MLSSDVNIVWDTMTVIPAADFIREHFGSQALNVDMPSRLTKDLFGRTLRDIPRTKTDGKLMAALQYNPLKDAFNKCSHAEPISNSSEREFLTLKCVNIRNGTLEAIQETGFNVTMSPDLILAPKPERFLRSATDSSNGLDSVGHTVRPQTLPSGKESLLSLNSSIYDAPAIIIKVQRESSYDIGIRAWNESALTSKWPVDPDGRRIVTPSTDDSPKQNKRSVESPHPHKRPTSKQYKFIAQILRYVVEQCATLPYRFLFSITICGEHLRIWRWSATGCIVTDSIPYQRDATHVYQFLQAIQLGPSSALGLDVGPDRTFSGVCADPEIVSKLKQLVMCYGEKAFPFESERKHWTNRAERGQLWEFKFPDHLFMDDDIKDKGPLLVISYPIFVSTGMFSRGTRCYIAIRKDLVLLPGKPSINNFYTLKTSWQSILRHSELSFFRKAAERGTDRIENLATVLAGGSIDLSLQKRGHFVVYDIDSEVRDATSSTVHATPRSSSPQHSSVDGILRGSLLREKLAVDGKNLGLARELQWIVFKEVGGRIKGFQNLHELIFILKGALEAHQTLMTRDILHRDVSESNILINLCNRKALFIDLDMAQDLREPVSTHGLEEASSMIPPAGPMHDSMVSYGPSDDVGHTSHSSQIQSLGKEYKLCSSRRSLTEDGHSDGDRHYPATEDDSEQSSPVTEAPEDRNDSDFVPPGGQVAVKPSPPRRMIFYPEMVRSGRPNMTGTPHFMSLHFRHRPIHRPWHDTESFYWISPIMYTLDEFERSEAINHIFPDDNKGRMSLSQLSSAKSVFLVTGKLRATTGITKLELLTRIINMKLSYVLMRFTQLLDSAETLYQNIKDMQLLLEMRAQSPDFHSPYSLKDKEAFKGYPSVLITEFEHILQHCNSPPVTSKLDYATIIPEVLELKTEIEILKLQYAFLPFPDHQWMLGVLQNCLEIGLEDTPPAEEYLLPDLGHTLADQQMLRSTYSQALTMSGPDDDKDIRIDVDQTQPPVVPVTALSRPSRTTSGSKRADEEVLGHISRE